MLRAFEVIIFLALVASVASAEQDQRRLQVAAATADASRRLANEVLSAQVSPQLTVSDLADQTGCRQALDEHYAAPTRSAAPAG